MSPTPINQVAVDPNLPVMGPILPAKVWGLIAETLNVMPSRLAPLDAVEAAKQINQRVFQTAIEATRPADPEPKGEKIPLRPVLSHGDA